MEIGHSFYFFLLLLSAAGIFHVGAISSNSTIEPPLVLNSSSFSNSKYQFTTTSPSLILSHPLVAPSKSNAEDEKPTNINLLRKLWSSTRSSKLNLTQQHQSLLRIESEKSNASSIPSVPEPPIMLYPEWLSSSSSGGGGVFPDDTNRSSSAGEYYPEEYDGPGKNIGERQEEEGPRLSQSDFLSRVANFNSWRDRMAASSAAVSADVQSNREQQSTEPPAPEAVIEAQDGLADVISRGRIDSVMYVYFGDKYGNDDHKEEIAGRVIQAVGGVVAAIAQVLTVLGAAKCVRKSHGGNQPPIHLHIGFALLLSNLLLLLAVHATEPTDVCASVAMILHYLHLVIGCWLFAHTMRTYLKLRAVAEGNLNLINNEPGDEPTRGGISRERVGPIFSSSVRYSLASWTAPLPFVLMSYLANPDGYETRHYCWMSIEKGMVISFIVPVFLLIGWNTLLVVLSLRQLLGERKLWAEGEMEEESVDERKISSRIRASAMLLPLLAIVWFLGVVALENASSIFFQIASVSANIALSWLVLYFLGDEEWPEAWYCCCFHSKKDSIHDRLSSLFPSSSSPAEGADGGCGSLCSVHPGAAALSFDSEPLLLPSSSSSSSGYGSSARHSICTQAESLPGPSSRPTGKRQHKSSSRRPNWSTPGGNEIYELRMDSISTICT